MSNPTQKDGGNGGGGGVVEVKVPLLQITFDPRTCQVAIAGSAPTTMFAKYMLLMALDGIEERIQTERAKRVEVPTPFDVGDFLRR